MGTPPTGSHVTAPSLPSDAAAPAVHAHDLVVSYDGVVALRAADLTLPRGRTTALIGPNGSGKSTLLNAIAGLAEVQGVMNVLGRRPRVARRSIAYVLQTTGINERVPLTVREVVTMGRYAELGAVRRLRAEDREIVDDSLERLDITDLAGRHITELSGGQRQRVFVAQGLAQRADLLLLDEPGTGLDFVSEERIADVVQQEVDRGRTVIVSTHDFADAQAADVVVLLAGEVVAVGPPEDILTQELISTAFGGHAHVLDDGTVLIDDPHHHGYL
ncbi:MAG: metal ABC transporter ATP-binding protein, partial [Actinobacteria bacterium]|nr:metal ABC transporter ATP-binding protein [Actinomycetota bacterium]